MAKNAPAPVVRGEGVTIPILCAVGEAPSGVAALLVERRGEQIVLDAQVTHGCTIILAEAAAAALFDILGAWLGGIPLPPGGDIA